MSYTFRFNNHDCFVGIDLYYSNFLKGCNYRKCCYRCLFNLGNHKSDFNVGEFIGVDITYQDFMDNKGVSYITFNTSKGENLFSKAKDYFEIVDVDLAIIIKPLL